MPSINFICWRLTRLTLNKGRRPWRSSVNSRFKSGRPVCKKCRIRSRKHISNQSTNRSSSWLNRTSSRFQKKISKFTSLKRSVNRLSQSFCRKLIMPKLISSNSNWASWFWNFRQRLNTGFRWFSQWSSNLKTCSRGMRRSKIATLIPKGSKMQSTSLRKIFSKNAKLLSHLLLKFKDKRKLILRSTVR